MKREVAEVFRSTWELWRKPYGPIVFVAAWLGGPIAAKAALRFFEGGGD